MVSQFISPHKVGLLSDLNFNFPDGIHAIGRLDNNSEGLLILTTNKKVTRLLFQSPIPHKRTYLVQVKNIVNEIGLHRLRTGVAIRIKGGRDHVASVCAVFIIEQPGNLYHTAFHLEEYGPHTWLSITITEGKFHQVRKMLAAIGHRCTRLIRLSIEDLALNNLPPGRVEEISEKDFFKRLKIICI